MKLKTKIMTFITVAILVCNCASAQKKYVIKCDNNLLQYSHKIALQQIGTKEKSNKNDGEVRKYLEMFGLKEGNPYCAAGQYYCFAMAAKQLKLPLSAIPIVKSALAQKVYNDAAVRGENVPYQAKVHDLIVWRKANTPYGHIERIHKIDKKGWVETIAFNASNIENGRQVEGVFIKRRNIKHPLGRLKIKGIVGFKATN